MKTAMIILSDTGNPRNKRSVALNDMQAISEIYERAGSEVRILYREDMESKLSFSEYDNLFVFYATLINFGGKQSDYVVRTIDLINSFQGPVVVFANDVMDPVNNKERSGFKRIERPVIYASPDGVGGSKTGTIELDVSEELEINQSFVIGQRLSQLPDVDMEPQYDVVYGGRDRPAMRRRLREVAKEHSLMVYSKIAKSMEEAGAKIFDSQYNFDNAQLRVINSLGKYSLMLKEKRKVYFTSRVFEQLFSNSIVLFDKSWPTLNYFWNEQNSFDGSVKDLLAKLDIPYNKERVKEQHELARSFDYDSYINQEAEELAKALG